MVLLVTPNCKEDNYGLTSHEFSAVQPNMYMHILESVYNHIKHISCYSIHMEADGYTTPQLLDHIDAYRPESIGIICSGSNPSASTMTMVGAIRLSKAIRAHGYVGDLFIWGGHPTVLPERTKYETGVDRVIIGTNFGCDVRDIPMVNWASINPRRYKAHNWHCFGDIHNRNPYAVIWTTLGCPYQCEFCCINNVFGKRTYLRRDMKDVLAEIDVMRKKFNVKHLKIMDELFVSKDHKRVNEFCDGIIERGYKLNMWCFARTDSVTPKLLTKMKKAGINWVAYGFESVNQDSVTAQRKGTKVSDYEKVIKWTKDAGISIIADFIAGFWEDSYETLEATYEFMARQNFEFINLYPLFAYPGTPLYERYIRKGIIDEPTEWGEYSLYGYDCKPCPTRCLRSDEVLAWRDKRYNEYYQRPEYQAMIQTKFGEETVRHVQGMSNMSLRRKICGDT